MIRHKLKFAGTAILLCSLAVTPVFTSCTDEDAPETTDDISVLSIDGNCEIYEINNNETSGWRITGTPAWITPVSTGGNAGDAVKVYVESNSRGVREGEIRIQYDNGRCRSVAVTQSDNRSAQSIQRTYAAGWSFDVRTYMDFRGLKEQVINTQKLYKYDKDIYRVANETGSATQVFYGESSSELSDRMSANLNLDSKFKTFSLDLQGSFGMSALNSSNRIFARVRKIYQERVVTLNQLDVKDAQTYNLFTADFADARKRVIDSNGSDEEIKSLINRYGTHVVVKAFLGGFYDYYFSSVVESSKNLVDVEAAIEFGFNKKFNFKANAQYKDEFESLNTERIEKFSVKGGDAISIVSAVESGSIDETVTNAWLSSLVNDTKYELISVQLIPLSVFFPREIRDKINAYTDRMYYSEVSVTRSSK